MRRIAGSNAATDRAVRGRATLARNSSGSARPSTWKCSSAGSSRAVSVIVPGRERDRVGDDRGRQRRLVLEADARRCPTAATRASGWTITLITAQLDMHQAVQHEDDELRERPRVQSMRAPPCGSPGRARRSPRPSTSAADEVADRQLALQQQPGRRRARTNSGTARRPGPIMARAPSSCSSPGVVRSAAARSHSAYTGRRRRRAPRPTDHEADRRPRSSARASACAAARRRRRPRPAASVAGVTPERRQPDLGHRHQRQQAADERHATSDAVAVVEPRGDQAELGDEARERRDARQAERRQQEQHGQERRTGGRAR